MYKTWTTCCVCRNNVIQKFECLCYDFWKMNFNPLFYRSVIDIAHYYISKLVVISLCIYQEIWKDIHFLSEGKITLRVLHWSYVWFWIYPIFYSKCSFAYTAEFGRRQRQTQDCSINCKYRNCFLHEVTTTNYQPLQSQRIWNQTWKSYGEYNIKFAWQPLVFNPATNFIIIMLLYKWGFRFLWRWIWRWLSSVTLQIVDC